MIVRVLFAMFVLGASPASACSYPGSQQLIYFDEVPLWFAGPDVLRVSHIGKAWFSQYHTFRVHETLKGDARPRYINIKLGSTASCGPLIGHQSIGIVLGKLRVENGEFVLDAQFETSDYRESSQDGRWCDLGIPPARHPIVCEMRERSKLR